VEGGGVNGFPDRAAIVRRFVGRDAAPTPEQRAAADEAWCRVQLLTNTGWKMRAWHPTSPGSPCTVKLDGYPGARDWDHQMIAGWMDHAYRLIAPDGRAVFVSEPYGVDGDALVRLTYLHSNGWRVALRPEIALHYPGRTVAIWIRKAGGAGD
jgi:hypothetical protein